MFDYLEPLTPMMTLKEGSQACDLIPASTSHDSVFSRVLLLRRFSLRTRRIFLWQTFSLPCLHTWLYEEYIKRNKRQMHRRKQ